MSAATWLPPCWTGATRVTVLDNLRTGHAAAVPPAAQLVTADLADG